MHHFVGLAEELHFGRAASKLGIAQPPFSQSIARLEEQLGLSLVNRERGRITLTPAGEAFAREARIVLRQAQVAEMTARRVNAGEVEELAVGFIETAMAQILPAAMMRFRQSFPRVKLRLHAEFSSVQITMLQHGELDLAIVIPPTYPINGLNLRIVESSPLVVCVPRFSPLAELKKARLAQLRDQRFILHPAIVQPHDRESLIAACRLAGFTPQIEEQKIRTFAIVRLVAIGAGVAFVPASTQHAGFEDVAFLPVEELPDIQRQIAIAWREGYTFPALEALTGAFHEIVPAGRAKSARS
jgi:DNA-binding transcriptional LysR family regulator